MNYRGFVVGFFFAVVAFLALAARFFAPLFFVDFLVDFFVVEADDAPALDAARDVCLARCLTTFWV